MSAHQFAGAIFDLDGTVYLEEHLIPGADEAITYVRDNGIEVSFVTNKAIERRSTYREKLRSFGISTSNDRIMTSSGMSAAYLAKNHRTDPIFVVGEAPLCQELTERGLLLTDNPSEATVLLASMDRDFDYERLTGALHAMDDTTAFLATNPDRTCPTQDGEIPDCGAVVGAIEGATGHELDHVIGKPSQTAIDAATSALDVDPERCLFVGDRLETDIQMGNAAGMTTILVLSGVSSRENVANSSIQPDYTIDSVAAIDSVLNRLIEG